MPKSAPSAPEMKILEPLITQSSPSRRRAVWIARAGSQPPDGSVSAEEAVLLAAQHRVEVALLLLLGRLVELGQSGIAEDAVAGCVEAGAVLRISSAISVRVTRSISGPPKSTGMSRL